MRCRRIKLFLFITITLATSCAVHPNTLFPPQVDEQTRAIFLVSHGWHAGIVLKLSDLQHSDFPKIYEFAQMDYLEIGWGDKNYYTSPEPGPLIAAKALLLPTSSVLHLVGFRGSPEGYFPYSEIIKIELSATGFEQMINRISKSFLHDEYGSVVYLSPGKYGNSRFYASKETYHLCKTCNTWTSTILRTAGCPFTSASTVSGLMSQARTFGEVMQEKQNSRKGN